MLVSRLWNLRAMPARALRHEAAGGFSAALIALPHGIGLGIIAFLPLGDAYLGLGLTAGIISAIIVTTLSALFGGTQGLISGGRASEVIIFSAVIAQLMAPDGLVPGFTAGAPLALLLALLMIFCAGILHAAVGALRVGAIIESIPHAIAAGFINAAAILILIGQAKSVLFMSQDASLFSFAHYLDVDSLARIGLAALTVAAIIAGRKLAPQIPSTLTGGLVGGIGYYIALSGAGDIDLGGTISAITLANISIDALLGFMDFTIAGLDAMATGSSIVQSTGFTVPTDALPAILAILIPATAAIAMLQSLDTIFTISALDETTQSRSNVNKELVVQGFATMLSSSLGNLGSSGSLLRTRANLQAGGRTAWSAIFSAGFLLLMLVLLAPVVSVIPKVVVSGVLFVIAFDIFDKWSLSLIRKFAHGSWPARRLIATDIFIIALVIVVAATIGFVEAVGAGLGVAILEFVMHMSRSPVRRILHGDVLHSRLQRQDQAEDTLNRYGNSIIILELEGALFFGSVGKVERAIDRVLDDSARHVILDLKRVQGIDSTAVRALTRSYRRIVKQGGTLSIAYIQRERRTGSKVPTGHERRRRLSRRDEWRKFDSFDGLAAIGEENFFDDTDAALRACENRVLQKVATTRHLDKTRGPDWPAVLHGLNRTQIKTVRRYTDRLTFSRGDNIFLQDDVGDTVFLVLRGTVDVKMRVGDTERQRRISTLSPGSIFGEMAFLDPMPRSATITATEDCVCYGIASSALENLIAAEPHIAITLLKNMSLTFTKRLRAANRAVIELES